jgi:hypothetical protein
MTALDALPSADRLAIGLLRLWVPTLTGLEPQQGWVVVDCFQIRLLGEHFGVPGEFALRWYDELEVYDLILRQVFENDRIGRSREFTVPDRHVATPNALDGIRYGFQSAASAAADLKDRLLSEGQGELDDVDE